MPRQSVLILIDASLSSRSPRYTLPQIAKAPAHHAMCRRSRSHFDLPCKRFSLVGAEKRGLAGRGARCQSFGAFSVETQYPIPHDLQRHAADPRGIAATTNFEYRRYRQQPTDLIGVAASSACTAQIRPTKVRPQSYRCRHRKNSTGLRQ